MNNKKTLIIVLTLSFLANLLIVLIFPFQCPWKVAFNIDCAGCGATRMTKALLALDFYQAFRFNPLIFTLFVLAILYGLYVGLCKILKKNYYKLNVKWAYALIVVLVVFTVLRNTSLFGFLKPTIVR